MAIPAILAALAAGGTAVEGFGNTILGFMNYDYQKKLQKEAWGREDNAVQRRVADLRAAGLSPTLAAGSAAAASPPIRAERPEITAGSSLSGALSDLVSLVGQQAKIAQTTADTALVNAKKDEVRARADFLDKTFGLRFGKEQNSWIMSEIQREIAEKFGLNEAEISYLSNKLALEKGGFELGTRRLDQEWFAKRGLPSNAGMDMFYRIASSLGGMGGEGVGAVIKLLGSLLGGSR